MRNEKGQFCEGNEIGKETRFSEGHEFSKKYNDKYCDEMVKYFHTYSGYPTFELFADSIGVIDDTLRNWCEEFPQFRHAYKRCMNIQKGKLIDNTLSEKYNANFAKFVAVNCHGMKERIEQDVNANGALEVNINVID